MGEGHFIKSVAIRWELVHTDNYLRSNPALVTLCTLPQRFFSEDAQVNGLARSAHNAAECTQRDGVRTTRQSAHTA